MAAFELLGGKVYKREPKRYEITHVPAAVRSRDRQIGTREQVLIRYERITFEKELVNVEGKPTAAFVCPGHPLLNAVIDMVLERYRNLLRQGAVLVAENDPSEQPRTLIYLEHTIQDARKTVSGQRHIVSRQMQFLEVDQEGNMSPAGYAPYLDYRPLRDNEKEAFEKLTLDWLPRSDLEGLAVGFAVENLVPQHFDRVRAYKKELVDKTAQAVKDRLTKEINYWDHRAEELRIQEEAGKVNARLNSSRARQRADDLQARLQTRLKQLEEEMALSPLPPVITGAALIIPERLLVPQEAEGVPTFATDQEAKNRVERLAMQAVMDRERALGYEPRDVSAAKIGYDIESKIPGTGRLRFIEVKGRVKGADIVTVTKKEILTCLNKPEDFILALVEVEDNTPAEPIYLMKPFNIEPDFGVTSVNYKLKELLARAEKSN